MDRVQLQGLVARFRQSLAQVIGSFLDRVEFSSQLIVINAPVGVKDVVEHGDGVHSILVVSRVGRMA